MAGVFARVLPGALPGALALAPLAAGAALMVASPAQAYTDPYKFLDSVKKKDGDAVEKALMDTNNRIVNTKDTSNGDTALHIVVARRDLTWLSYLIGKGADVNVQNDSNITPLQVAVDQGWADGVSFLIAQHANVDPVNDAGETPLMSATHRKNLQIMRLLLEAGANPARTDNSGRSSLDYAKLDGDRGVLDVLGSYAKNAKATSNKGMYGPSIP
ncbi:ankyrin repeat domain-containing protein [Novosphingobium sp. 9]|uniref:ankyrin repeat domain-containing protein n=1 Tax=Novosphingobium sp. 9 TaxID=2025349 RepID=UPI0021B52638|nr:ankyrin repeat domain-containing protein [Novosphingobium sp. 9]